MTVLQQTTINCPNLLTFAVWARHVLTDRHIEVSVVAGVHDFERADERASILSKAITAETAMVESAVIGDSLQSGLNPHQYRATYINIPFRREEYQAAAI